MAAKKWSWIVLFFGELFFSPTKWAEPPNRGGTHSLRAGGANALSLAGYSDRDSHKMGRWRGETFKEYIREDLHCFAEGMSTAMTRDFKFVHIAGGAYIEFVDNHRGQ